MVVVLVASLVLAIYVARRERLRRIAAHQRAMMRAQLEFDNAKLTREAAEIAVIEYTEGVFKDDLRTVENEIVLAKAGVARSQEQLATASRLGLKGKDLESFVADGEEKIRRAERRLELAQQKKTVLVNETKHRTLNELAEEVKKAKASETARKADYEKLKAIPGPL
jgi:hypothetical protein